MKRGISVITLIITIVVIIILSTIIIININSNNTMSKAEIAVFLNNVDNYKSELYLYIVSGYTNNENYNPKLLNADKNMLEYNKETIKDKTMKDVITIMKKEDLNKFIVDEGELKYIGSDKEEEDILDGIVGRPNLMIDFSIKEIGYSNILLNINMAGEYLPDVESIKVNFKTKDEDNFLEENLKDVPFEKNSLNVEYNLQNLSYEKTYDLILTVSAKGRVYQKKLNDIVLLKDTSVPTIPTDIHVTSYINSLAAKASGSYDKESGIQGYKYSIDNTNWSDVIPEEDIYTFENIKSNYEVTIYAKAVNMVNLESEVFSKTTSTSSVIENVILTRSTNAWTNTSLTVTLSYKNEIPNGYTLQYKVLGTPNWTDGVNVTIDNNTTVYGRLYNSSLDDEIAVNSIDITNIDKVPPKISFSKNGDTVYKKANNTAINVNDNVVTVIRGRWMNGSAKLNNESDFTGAGGWVASNNQTITIDSNTPSGDWYLWIYARDEAGNYTITSSNVFKIDNTAPSVPSVYGLTLSSSACPSWQKSIYATFSSSDAHSLVSYYELDWDSDGIANMSVSSPFTAWDGYSSCNNRFRAIDKAGNIGAWSAPYHIHVNSKITVSNLIANSGFRNGYNGWQMNKDYAASPEYGGYGGSEYFLNTWYSGDTGKAVQYTVLTAGHKYYMRASGECNLWQDNLVISNNDYSEMHRLTFGTGWSTKSQIIVPASTKSYRVSAGNNVAHVGHWAHTTSILLIDLTGIFGYGAEPSQAWCDGNIPWFDGSINITRP